MQLKDLETSVTKKFCTIAQNFKSHNVLAKAASQTISEKVALAKILKAVTTKNEC